jgi:AraC-like DNA-binding protein
MPDQPNPAAPVRSHWTPAKQRVFLTALVETGSVARAARAAGMSRSSAHALRNRLTGTPFDHHWNHALRLHAARLADPFAPDPLAPRKAPGDSPRRAPDASASRP